MIELDRTTKLLLLVAFIIVAVIIGSEEIVYHYEVLNFPHLVVYQADTAIGNFFRMIIRYVIDWSFEDYPSYITILIYSTVLNQRHRAYLHILLYSSSLFVTILL